MNRPIVIPTLVVVISACAAFAAPSDYWRQRSAILSNENSRTLGANLTLTLREQKVNDVILTAKLTEIQMAFENDSLFLPAQNFMTMKSEIGKSEVFKFIQRMPKGAVLHCHDTAIVTADWIYKNVTYRPNLYVCDANGTLKLRFFDEPTTDCDWKLLSDLRKNERNANTLNERIYRQMTMLTEEPDKVYADVDKAWAKFMNIFAFIAPMLAYRPVYEDHFYQGLEEHYSDNVIYLEVRSTLPNLYELNGTTYSSLETVNTYKKVTSRFMKDHPDFVGVKIIYAPVRSVSQKTMNEYLEILKQLKRAHPSFVAGFDLVGQEDKGKPLSVFADKLRNFEPPVNYFFHAGETNWYGLSTDENIVDAVLLGAKRIGHGFALTKHPLVLEIMKQQDIPVEVNPISNQVLGLVKDFRNHPASVLFSQGFPIVISNDDPGLWDSRALSYDLYQAFVGLMHAKGDLRALKQLAINSLAYSCMNQQEKARAFQIWERQWNRFINDVSSDHDAVLI